MPRKSQKTVNKRLRHIVIALIIVAVCIATAAYCLFFAPLSKADSTQYVYIDADDNIDSVHTKIETASGGNMHGFRILAAFGSYKDNIRTGRYAIDPADGALTVFRRMKNGMQEPVNLTVPSVRTLDRLAAALGNKLMTDSATIYNALADSSVCARYGYERHTVHCMFIPNTYSVYWNISVDKLFDRMKKESDKFWDGERQAKADSIGMTRLEVVTLASIVDEETANDGEKPMIAGMYINRLNANMPLQADPTVKYAIGDFKIRRIYNNMLRVKSPYNTYTNVGLPPGPIRIPSVAGIDAVLNYAHHDYIFMCAKEDFSGTHNFASTYREHLANARKYTKALNERGIK